MKDYQKAAIETVERKVIVNSAAAAGKTFVITERVKWLIKQNINKDRIVVITFTNNAADEMRKRLKGEAEGVFIGTLHSYMNYILLCAGVSTAEALDKEDYDKLFVMITKNPRCIKPVEHLLLDEAQDSDEKQWHFILDQVKPTNLFAVGDLNQSIYGFNGAVPEIMEKMMDEPDTTIYNLPINYRNDRSILAYAKRIINKGNYTNPDNSIASSSQNGQVIEAEYSDDSLVNYIQTSIKQGATYGDWFVLGRSNAQVTDMFNALQKKGIPCDTFKKADFTNEQLSKKMADNTVKVLTIHSSKGLENNYVAVQGGLFFNEEEKRVCYVAATRAKHVLIWYTRPKKLKRRQKVFNWE